MQVVSTVFGVGCVENDEIAILDTPFPHAGAVIEATGSLDVLTRCSVRERVALQGATLLAPLGSPRAVWGVGLNYQSKAAHTGRGLPSEPILYLGAPSAVLAPDAEVAVPSGRTVEMDYEGEVAIIIGRRLYRADPEQVWPSIAGITAANDMTARDVMRATATPTLAKSFPGFNPLGASVCTVDEFADRDCIPVRTWLNDELRQDDTSAGMIFSVPDLLARISWFAALEPGDVVLTGTPAGTGQDRGSYLTPGDRIRIEVGPVLPLVTTVAAPSRDHPSAG
ncbi:fumarylacetoacetate hydrolase family protein [Dactylosporangium salmoneum]|uniref:fumarylacetoacetate hydrolase family protein n=1 Tax=Dactylosporangium salmoneum TaxID=53361 RepID=UPI0031D4E287